MGKISKFFGGENKGVDCEFTDDGRFVCNVIKNDGREIVTTGSSFEGQMVGCEPNLTGHNRILEEDERAVKKSLEQMKRGCRVKPGVANQQ